MSDSGLALKRRSYVSTLHLCLGASEIRYGRVLAHCRIGDLDLNGAMVRAGWAVAEWRAEYRLQQDQARAEHVGAWAGTLERPKLWRKAHH